MLFIVFLFVFCRNFEKIVAEMVAVFFLYSFVFETHIFRYVMNER